MFQLDTRPRSQHASAQGRASTCRPVRSSAFRLLTCLMLLFLSGRLLMAQVLTDQRTTAPAVRAWTRLLRAYASTTRLLSAELQAEHGLTISDYEALLVLSRAEDSRMKRVDLARSLMLTPSGITRLLEGLEDAGLVKR